MASKFCLILALASSVLVDATIRYNANARLNGPASYARSLQKWSGKVPDGLRRLAYEEEVAKKGIPGVARPDGQTGGVAATSFKGDLEYLSIIGFGTPPQYLSMDLDTGSADVWVWSSETKGDVGNRSIYNVNASSTARKVNNASWFIEYGDGSFAYGKVYRDTITVGPISLPKATVETVQSVSYALEDDYDLDGIFGLAYNLSNQVEPEQPTVMSVMSSVMKENLFTVDLKHKADGAYTFGTLKPNANTTVLAGDQRIHYVPLYEDAEFWEIAFTGFSFSSLDYWLKSRWSAIVDTGTTLMLMPEEIVTAYYNTSVPGATLGNDTFMWTFPCDTELPDFYIGFGGGKHKNGSASAAEKWNVTIPGRYFNYTTLDTDLNSTTCVGGMQSGLGMGFSILGDVFLKAIFAVFDIGGKRIGFAEKQLND